MHLWGDVEILPWHINVIFFLQRFHIFSHEIISRYVTFQDANLELTTAIIIIHFHKLYTKSTESENLTLKLLIVTPWTDCIMLLYNYTTLFEYITCYLKNILCKISALTFAQRKVNKVIVWIFSGIKNIISHFIQWISVILFVFVIIDQILFNCSS